MDFVSQLVRFGEVSGISIRKDIGGTLNLRRLNEHNLNNVISFMKRLSVNTHE